MDIIKELKKQSTSYVKIADTIYLLNTENDNLILNEKHFTPNGIEFFTYFANIETSDNDTFFLTNKKSDYIKFKSDTFPISSIEIIRTEIYENNLSYCSCEKLKEIGFIVDEEDFYWWTLSYKELIFNLRMDRKSLYVANKNNKLNLLYLNIGTVSELEDSIKFFKK